jgi:hypothetical protein
VDDPAGPSSSITAETLRKHRRANARGQSSAARRGPGARQPERLRDAEPEGQRLDPNRLSLLIAVLGKRAGIPLGSQDVYANIAGGLTVLEPALDLALALALASSARDRPVAAGTVAIGEVGLLGELRSVGGLDDGCARRPGWGSRARSSGGRPPGTRRRRRRWHRGRGGRHGPRRHRGRLADRPAPRGDALPAMLG